MLCPGCEAQNREGVKFCEDCGARLGPCCPSCGAEVLAGKRFCGTCGAQLEEPADLIEPADARASAAPGEERRWATVLFADLAGFTALSERMDPEDVKAMAHRCAEQMAEEIHRFGGTVIDVMGDAVMAVFGAPVAHEDDAERAVRAALAIRGCALEAPDGERLRVHVGINTGEVMAGQIGPEERRQYVVMGDTTNTAARLMSSAPADTILVGEETYRATSRLVRYRELPPIEAKGKARPVRAWEVLEVAPLPEARPLGTAPLVGRDDALAILEGTWARVVREVQPHLVSVLGEPGIGKSRLAAELERRALGEALVLHGRCLAYGEALGYWALAAALKEAAGITGEQDAAAARARLGDLVSQAIGADDDPAEVGRHLALLSGLDRAADRAGPTADQRTLHGSVRRFLEALARRRPLCLIVEDLHWADGALLDLVEFIAARAQDAPLLIVTLARPELLEKRPAWGGGVRAFSSLPLQPLGEDDAGALVAALCREHGLPEELVEQIGRGAGGNPLFAEELVATVAERGASTGVPSAIKALISARLDALPPEQRAALQRAAVVGKHFWAGGLRALGTPDEIDDHLEVLEQRDFLRSQPRSWFRGDREYAFKHDLIRDVAYETLPRADRRALHGRLVDWMERAAGERVVERLDVLAYHAARAEQHARAVDYLVRAAERACRAAAHREEAALYGRAVELAQQAGRTELLADLRTGRGKAFASVALWKDARAELEAALDNLPPEALSRRAEILVDLAGTCLWSLDTATARRRAAEALAVSNEVGREDLAIRASVWLAACASSDGELDAAIDGYTRATARAEQLGVPLHGSQLVLYSVAMYWAGKIEAAVERSRVDIEIARSLADAEGMMLMLGNRGMYLAAAGRYAEAAAVLEEARRFGREHEVDALLARAIVMSAGFHLDLWDYDGAQAISEEGCELARASNWLPTVVSGNIDLLLSFVRRGEVTRAEGIVDQVAETVVKAAGFHGWLWRLRLAEARAELALAREAWDEAVRLADDAIAQCRAKGRVKYHVLGLGTRAGALARLGRTNEAIVDLRSAVDLARPTGDPAMLLRAATALLALDGDDALRAEARAAAERILTALPDENMRRRFEAAEPVRLLSP